jgi:membrane protease YdiL (CAAX protease family)
MPSKQRDRGPPAGAVRRHGKPAGLPAGFRWRETGLWPALRVHRQRPCGAPSGSTPFPPLRASPGKSLRAFPHRPLPKANQQQHLLGNSTSGTAALRWPLLLHHLTGLRLAMFLGVQFIAGIVIVIIWIIIAMAHGENPTDPSFAPRLAAKANVSLLLGGGLASALAVFAISRLWAWNLIRDKTNNGVGIVASTTRKTLLWGFIGASLGCGYVAAIHWTTLAAPVTALGPLSTIAAGGGTGRMAWAVLALLYAPIVEEFVFRGLLLRGFTSSWGQLPAACVVTILFVILHLTETYHFWPAIVAISILGLAALFARISTNSLVPAIVVHGAYNLILVVSVFTGIGSA